MLLNRWKEGLFQRLIHNWMPRTGEVDLDCLRGYTKALQTLRLRIIGIAQVSFCLHHFPRVKVEEKQMCGRADTRLCKCQENVSHKDSDKKHTPSILPQSIVRAAMPRHLERC